MKVTLFICLTIILLSCNREGSLFGSSSEEVLPPRKFSGIILTPADAGTPLSQLVSANGTRMQIRGTDSLRIRFFDRDFIAHETIIGTVGTVGALFSAISSACQSFGVSATVTPDTAQTGTLILTTSGASITSLLVENMTNTASNAQVQKSLIWKGIVGGETKSEGLCLTYATASSLLRSLRDSSGTKLGLEPNDIVRVRGETSQGAFPEENSVLIDSSGTQTISTLFALMSSDFPESSPAFGMTSISTEIGRATINIPTGETAGSFSFQLVVEENSNVFVSPTYFNNTMVFK